MTLAMARYSVASAIESATHPSALLPSLTDKCQDSLRKLFGVIPPPSDPTSFPQVLDACCASIRAYADSLHAPSNRLHEILGDLVALRAACSTFPRHDVFILIGHESSKAPSWRLLVTLNGCQCAEELRIAVGAELAASVLTGKRFHIHAAKQLLRALTDNGLAPDPSLVKLVARIRNHADALFETAQPDKRVAHGSRSEEQFREALLRHHRVKIYFGRNREHQAIADHRSQAGHQLIASAAALKKGILDDDETALFNLIESLAGLPEDLFKDLPLISKVTGDWLMCLDPDSGYIKLSVDLFAAERATPESDHANFEAVGDIVLVPLPKFAAARLADLATERPDAVTVGELLRGRRRTPKNLAGNNRGILSSVPRMRNGLAPFAVALGIGRYVASLMLNNPCLVPTGKYYYGRITRGDIWAGTKKLYGALGWESPVPLDDGLSAGARTIPTDTAISSWFRWMSQEVETRRPPKRYSFDALLSFHNTYALACASLSVFLLALRHRKILPLNRMATTMAADVLPIFDKRVGEFPGPMPVPVTSVLGSTFSHWHSHCAALTRRIETFDTKPGKCASKALHRWALQDGAAFFTLSAAGALTDIGSQHLVEWWPESQRGNFGRKFWEDRLMKAGLKDSDIDRTLRHTLSGSDPLSSVGHDPTAAWAKRVSAQMDSIVGSLGIVPLRGLMK